MEQRVNVYENRKDRVMRDLYTAKKALNPEINNIMRFKKGDTVQVWDDDEDIIKKGEYVIFNTHPEAQCPHLVRLYRRDGITTGPGIFCFPNCRYPRVDLQMDTPVWVKLTRFGPWLRRHFAGWAHNGYMKCWVNGGTSHTVKSDDTEVMSTFVAFEFSLTQQNNE